MLINLSVNKMMSDINNNDSENSAVCITIITMIILFTIAISNGIYVIFLHGVTLLKFYCVIDFMSEGIWHYCVYRRNEYLKCTAEKMEQLQGSYWFYEKHCRTFIDC